MSGSVGELLPGFARLAAGKGERRGRKNVPFEGMTKLDYRRSANWSPCCDLKTYRQTVPVILERANRFATSASERRPRTLGTRRF